MKQKLWATKARLHPMVEAFTVGDDPELDRELLPYDVLTNLAHISMLKSVGVLTQQEFNRLRAELHRIQKLIARKSFRISRQEEDVHTAIENHLTKKLGVVGKKVHTARSRNDQVLSDLRLYAKDQILKISQETCKLISLLLTFAKKYRDVPLPGYTHMRKAMPSSLSMWAAGFAEALLEDVSLAQEAYGLCETSPLGTGSGFGLPIKIKPEMTARLLGFAKAYESPIAAQLGRGKVDSAALFAMTAIAQDLGRLASELLLYTTDEFGFFELPEELTTGSSIMPQKQNPDVLELTRAYASRVRGCLFEMLDLCSKLPSGYQRDLQLTKRPLFEGFRVTGTLIQMMALVMASVKPNRNRIQQAMTSELYETERALKLVTQGAAFRDAYLQVKLNRSAQKKISGRSVPKFDGASLMRTTREVQTKIARKENVLHEKWRRL